MTKIGLEDTHSFAPRWHPAEQSCVEQRRSCGLVPMNDDSQNFFEEEAECSRVGFKARFAKICRRLGISQSLGKSDIACLYEAAFLAALCNIAFNGLGGCRGAIRPEKEAIRCRLEQSFMDACSNLCRCSGWRKLNPERKKSIRSIFLNVCVAEENLAE